MIKQNLQGDRKFTKAVSNSIWNGWTKRILSIEDFYINFGTHWFWLNLYIDRDDRYIDRYIDIDMERGLKRLREFVFKM